MNIIYKCLLEHKISNNPEQKNTVYRIYPFLCWNKIKINIMIKYNAHNIFSEIFMRKYYFGLLFYQENIKYINK